jgi:hypothetical protein
MKLAYLALVVSIAGSAVALRSEVRADNTEGEHQPDSSYTRTTTDSNPYNLSPP